MSTITNEEAASDLAKTIKDEAHLDAIVKHLTAFIYETDQDRNFLKTDLIKYQSMQRDALNLRIKIQDFIRGNGMPVNINHP